MVIKHASRKDIAALTAVETACFPPAEAATEKEFIDRVQYYGNHFWLLYEGDISCLPSWTALSRTSRT